MKGLETSRISSDLYGALWKLKEHCDKKEMCSDCPLSVEYNSDGDVMCIFQRVRPNGLSLHQKVICTVGLSILEREEEE